MIKGRKTLSMILCTLMTLSIFFSLPINNAYALAKNNSGSLFNKMIAMSKIKINISNLKTSYYIGDRTNIKITSQNYSKVQYRVVVFEMKTKKSQDITKGYTKVVAASTPLIINLPTDKIGSFGYTVYAKRSGAKNYESTITKYYSVKKKTATNNVITVTKPNIAVGGGSKNIISVNNDVKIYASNIRYNYAVVSGNIYVNANKCILNNVTAKGTIFINPGENGEINLNNVKAADIRVLSGGQNSIHFNNVLAGTVTLDTQKPARVVTEGSTAVGRTMVNSSAILEASSGTFGSVEVAPKANTNNSLELRGNFDKSIVVKGESKIKADETANVPKLELSPDKSGARVTLSGIFREVEVNNDSNLEMSENTIIRDTMRINAALDLRAAATAKLTKVDVAVKDSSKNVTLTGYIELVNVNSATRVTVSEGTRANIVINTNNAEINAQGNASINLDKRGNTATISGEGKDKVKETKLDELEKSVDSKIAANQALDKAAADKQAADKSLDDAKKAAAQKAIDDAKKAAEQAQEQVKQSEEKASQNAGNNGQTNPPPNGGGSSTGGNTGGSSGGSSAVHVDSITLDIQSAVLNINGSVKLLATISPSNADNKSVTWSSNNRSVAAVDNNGNVTGKSEGTAVITVKSNDGGKTATCQIKVVNGQVEIYNYNNQKTTINFKGKSQTGVVTIEILDDKGNIKYINQVNLSDGKYTFKVNLDKGTYSGYIKEYNEEKIQIPEFSVN